MCSFNCINILFCYFLMRGLSTRDPSFVLRALVYIPIVCFIVLIGFIACIIVLIEAKNTLQSASLNDGPGYFHHNSSSPDYFSPSPAISEAKHTISLCNFIIIPISGMVLTTWPLFWISFYKAYQYLKVAYPPQPPQGCYLPREDYLPHRGLWDFPQQGGSSQQAISPQQGFLPQHQQGYSHQQVYSTQQGFPPQEGFPLQPCSEAPPPYSLLDKTLSQTHHITYLQSDF